MEMCRVNHDRQKNKFYKNFLFRSIVSFALDSHT